MMPVFCTSSQDTKQTSHVHQLLMAVIKTMTRIATVDMFRAFYQSAQFINWPAQSRNYRLGAQFINRVRNLEIESRASNERSVHVLYIA